MKHTKKNKLTTILHFLVWGYLILMLAGFPFFFRHGYADLTEAKRIYFQSISIVFLTVASCLLVLSQLRQDPSAYRARYSRTDFWAVTFAVTIIISCVLSPAGAEAFWGREGRRLGGLFLLLCIGIYFAVSRCYQPQKWLFWLFFVSTILLWLIVVCNFWDWDVLGMRSHLTVKQKSEFLGTLGNVNINAGYSCTVTAFLLGFYYRSEGKLLKRCSFGASVLGIYTCYCTCSDSWLLGVGGVLLLLLMLSMGKPDLMRRWIGCGAAFLCASFFMKLSILAADAIDYTPRCIRLFEKQEILYPLTEFQSLLVGLLLLAALYGLTHTPCMPFLKQHGNKILIVLLLLAIVAAAIAVLPLKDSFGTNRGYIWKRTLKNYGKLPFWQKLFGYGPNCFLQSMEARFGAQMRARYGAPFLDAHNEFLQMLTVTGALGAVSYLGMQISLLKRCLKKRRTETLDLAGAAGITAYLLQGLVNNPSVFLLPLLFILLGILERQFHQKHKRGVCS